MEIVANDAKGKLVKAPKSENKCMLQNVKKPSSRIVTITEEPYDGGESENFESFLKNSRNSLKGGYHPVQFGDLYNNRYSVIDQLGCGYFSTVWLSWDLAYKRFVALKVVRSEFACTQSALFEIALLKCVQEKDPSDSSRNNIIQLLDHFRIYGVNGMHICLVFEPMGPDLKTQFFYPEYRRVPLTTVKAIVRQVIQALDYMHNKCQIIHNDINLENILRVVDENCLRKLAYEAVKSKHVVINLPNSPIYDVAISQSMQNRYNLRSAGKIGCCISMKEICSDIVESINDDFSGSGYLNRSESSSCHQKKCEVTKVGIAEISPIQINEKANRVIDLLPDISNVSVKIGDFGVAGRVHLTSVEVNQTAVPYRSLEVLLDAPYGPPADIWSVACFAFELATGDFLFNVSKDDPNADEVMDDDHLTLMIKLLGKIPRSIALSGTCSGNFFTERGTLQCRFRNPEYFCLYDVLTKKFRWEPAEAQSFSDFIIPMLTYDPKQRATASDCLKHPWLTLQSFL